MEIDNVNLLAPLPLLSPLRAMDKLKPVQVLKITTHEAGAVNNLVRLYQQLGYKLMEVVDWEDEYTLLVKKTWRH